MENRAQGAVFGALLGDALALQTHYEYDYRRIRDFYRIVLNGTVEKLAEELRRNAAVLGIAVTPDFRGADMKNWHPGKEGGDLTDYGDCVVMALEFLAEHGWSVDAFDAYWWKWIQSYGGYLNMATKAIILRRRKGQNGPARLGWPPAEDLFAVCRLPALVFAFRTKPVARGKEEGALPDGPGCQWSAVEPGVLEPYPAQLAVPFSTPGEAKRHCEHLGTGLCGGICCWGPKHADPSAKLPSRVCGVALAGAKWLPDEGGARQAVSSVLRGCGENLTRRLPHVAMESASIQYATESTFHTASFLAALTERLLRDSVSTRKEVQRVMHEVAGSLAPRSARAMGAVVEAVGKKLAEVEANGSSWASDPVEVDDWALQTFTYTSAELVAYAPYPCNVSDCGYWGVHGKASPTLPALAAALYLTLRYAQAPPEHALAVNALLGGDTAARGVVLGMLIGAIHGADAMPTRLLEQLRARRHVADLLRRL